MALRKYMKFKRITQKTRLAAARLWFLACQINGGRSRMTERPESRAIIIAVV